VEKYDKNIIKIKEIPFGTTTASLIESIIKASEKGKLKIKKIEDNTSSNVEVLVYLPSGASMQKSIDSLFAFTQCEVSISPLCCIISDNKPEFLGVKDILKTSTENTKDLLKKELEIQLNELESQWHTISLERIFIENRIYRDIEEKTTWDDVISTIDKGLEPFKKNLKREVSVDDIKKLTEIPIRKISKFDLNKVKEKLNTIEITIEEVKNNLNHIIDYTIQYFTHLKKHYGKERKRKTIIEEFDDLDKKKISIKNQKLYVNKEEGFIGTSLKKDEFISDCSDLDDVIVFTKQGIMKVVKVDSKVFIGKDILHVSLFNSDIKEKTYNLIYRDGKNGTSFMKRFKISGVIRDKEYYLTQGKEGSEVLYFSSNTKGIADVVTIHLRKRATIKKIKWEVDFADLAIKGRDSKGNIVTKYTIRKVSYREKNSIEKRIKKIDEIEVNDEEQVSNNSEENQTKLNF
jgi:topoisomerase-4 subunit A